MADNMTILVGTSGQGVLRSADGGDTWRRIAIDQGLHSDAVVRCLAVHPNKPNLIYAGSDKGIYTSTDAGENWSQDYIRCGLGMPWRREWMGDDLRWPLITSPPSPVPRPWSAKRSRR